MKHKKSGKRYNDRFS